jgi:phage major head subunit gpT-like protein
MTVLTPATLQSRWDAATLSFNTLFQQTLLATKPQHGRVATTLPSNSREEAYPWLDRIPKMRKWVGERRVNDLAARMQVLVNEKYEDTVKLLRTDLEDDKIGLYTPLIQEVARQSAMLPETLVAEAVIAGTSAVVYDGQFFFDTDHPVNMDDASITGPSGAATQANLLTTHPLSTDNLADAIQTMQAWVGADGLPLEITPDLLVVPPQLRFLGARLLQAELIGADITLSGPTHGAAAQSNILKGSLDLFVWPRLAVDPTSYYVLCTTSAVKPFIFQERIAPQFTYLTKPEDQNVFLRDEYLYGVRARCAAGYGPWFMAIKCTA